MLWSIASAPCLWFAVLSFVSENQEQELHVLLSGSEKKGCSDR